MVQASRSQVDRDVLSEFDRSQHTSVAAFAAELGVPRERVEYWLSLARIKRRLGAKASCD